MFIKNGRQIKLTAHGKILLQRAENLLAEAENIRTDLYNEQKILTEHYRLAATYCEKHPGFQKLKIKPKVTNLFDSYDVAIKALKTNAFWTLLPNFLANNYRDELAFYQPKRWQADYFIAAIWPKNNLRTRGLNIVIDKIKQHLKSQ